MLKRKKVLKYFFVKSFPIYPLSNRMRLIAPKISTGIFMEDTTENVTSAFSKRAYENTQNIAMFISNVSKVNFLIVKYLTDKNSIQLNNDKCSNI